MTTTPTGDPSGQSPLPPPHSSQWILSDPETTKGIDLITWDASNHSARPYLQPSFKMQEFLFTRSDDLEGDSSGNIQWDFGSWAIDPDARWIAGWPGTGKTMIARSLAQSWAYNRCLAASFFFSRSSPGRDTTLYFCETILFQLSQHFNFDLPRAGNSRNRLSIEWLLIVQILQRLLPLSEPVVIVIDGIDEIRSEDEQEALLLALLPSVALLGPSIKFLFTSQPLRHLRDIFAKFGVFEPCLLLGQSPHSDGLNIQLFLETAFRGISHARRKVGTISITDGSWPSAQAMHELVDRADGQWTVATSMVSFVDSPVQDPVERLRGLLDDQTPSFQIMDELASNGGRMSDAEGGKRTKSLDSNVS